MLLSRTLRASLPALVLFIFLTTIITIVFGSLIYFFEMGTFMVSQSVLFEYVCVCAARIVYGWDGMNNERRTLPFATPPPTPKTLYI